MPNPFGFDPFLQSVAGKLRLLSGGPFAQKAVRAFTGAQADPVDAADRQISSKVSFRWRKMADAIAWPEKRPYMMHYDGHKNRIVRPYETLVMEKEIFGEA